MYIKQVKLKNFKIFKYHEIDFSRGFNIIVGSQATGKSTIIDAIRFIIDPQFENSSAEFNLYNFIYKPHNSNASQIGFVELSFDYRDKDKVGFIVRREFFNLKVVKINGQNARQEMKMRDFYNFLRNLNIITNSFMPSFINVDVLYKVENNNGLFKNLSFLMTDIVKFHSNIRNLILSIENILKTKLEKLTNYPKNFVSILTNNESSLINRFQSICDFNEYIYNLRIQRNKHIFLQNELDKLNYLEEIHCGIDIYMFINDIINFEENTRIKCQSSNFFSISDCMKKINSLVHKLNSVINDIYVFDVNNVVSYPMKLNAQHEMNRYIINLKKTLKTNKRIAESIKGDIQLINKIVKRKRSVQENLIQSIESNLCDFAKTKLELEDSIMLADTEDVVQPYKYFIEFFLNDRLFYSKMKLILCFDYNPNLLNSFQLVNTIYGQRILPVFNCIIFKHNFILKDYFYEYLKPVLDWIIIFETTNEPFIIHQQTELRYITWVPTNNLYHYKNTSIELDTEFQYIWDGIDFKKLYEMDVLTKSNIKYLKFIFYQQQLKRKYESSLMFGGTLLGSQDIIELCDTLQNFYRLLLIRHEHKSYKNIFYHQTDIPNNFFIYKENLDSLIFIAKNLKNNFIMLLTIAEELEYHEEDIQLKTRCLKLVNDDADPNMIVDCFNLQHFKNSSDNIDQYKLKIEEMDSICISLNYKFNKLFVDVYLPFYEITIIAPNSIERVQKMLEWKNFVISLEFEISYWKRISNNNLLAIAEVKRMVNNMKKTFLTDDEEFQYFINKNEPIKSSYISKSLFYETLQNSSCFVEFQRGVYSNINHAIKIIEKVNGLKLTSDLYSNVKIQIHDQVNNSLEIANQLLENFNHKIKIGFNDWVDNLEESINEDNKLNVLKSFHFIIQKKSNLYLNQSKMNSFIEDIPTQSDFYLSKLMFILGVSLHNKHKLLTFDDISVLLNKNKDVLIKILSLDEICDDQQIIMTCNPDEIITENMEELTEYFTQVSEHDIVNYINIDGCA